MSVNKKRSKTVTAATPNPPAHVPERQLVKDASTCWLEQTNPLVGVSIQTAQAIFDCARQGDTQRLHWLYQEIEAKNPVLMTCIERRAAAIANFTWTVTPRAEADRGLAEEQQDAVRELIANIENFTELLEHLDGAFFRGFALAQPVWTPDGGAIKEVTLRNSWEFVRKDGTFWWCPNCNGFDRDAVDCRDAGLVGVERARAIDYPALSIHIRHAVGERDWGRFLERYALPKPAVTMAPNATNAQRGDYIVAAKAVENGQCSVWPNGSTITDFAGGSRGTDPFNAFIRHQEEHVVLLATGGTLTSLATADTGALAGGAQMEVWKQIVNRDAGVLTQAVTSAIVRPFLERQFWGRPKAVDFALDMPTKMTPKEAAEVAATLKTAGWRVNQAELEKATGFSLEKDDTPALPPAPGFNPGHPGAAVPAAPAEDVSATALNGAQVTSMVTLLQQASQGQIPKDSIMPILKAAFPNVADETLHEIVGPLDKFSAGEAIARARAAGKNPAFGGGTPPGSGALGTARSADGEEGRLKRLKAHGGVADDKGDGSGVDALAEAFSRVLAETMADELTKGGDHE